MADDRVGGSLFPAGTFRYCLLLTAVFSLSRLIYYAAGIRPLDDLSSLIQIADLNLLQTDLFRTVLLLHFQPPFFNLLVGVVLKLAPGNPAVVFHVLYLVLGLILTLCLFLLALRLGLARLWAAVLAGLFVVTPATILLENWAFYTYPVTLLLVLCALALNLFVATRKPGWLFGGLFCAAALVLTRSMFHPLWLLTIPAALFALLPDRRRIIVTASLVPLLLVGLWMIKNSYTVGSMSTSTLLGMNFSKITIMQLPGQERTRMYAAGEMSVFGLYSPFRELDYYREKTGQVGEYMPTGIPVLDEEYTFTGAPNFNHPAYVDISKSFLKDDLAVVRKHPGVYARGVAGALSLYLQPPHDQIFTADNVERIKPVMRLFDVALYGQLSSLFRDNYHSDFQDRINLRRNLVDLGLFVLAALLIVIIYWPVKLISGGLALARSSRGITLWFMGYSLIYVTVLANMLEIGENARLRYPVEPFLWLLLALALAGANGAGKIGPADQ